MRIKRHLSELMHLCVLYTHMPFFHFTTSLNNTIHKKKVVKTMASFEATERRNIKIYENVQFSHITFYVI